MLPSTLAIQADLSSRARKWLASETSLPMLCPFHLVWTHEMTARSGVQVGIAFSRRLKAQNIGHIIPVPVIQRFLTEFEMRGNVNMIDASISVRVFPVESSSSALRTAVSCLSDFSFLQVTKMENQTLRKYYGMNAGQSGGAVVLIRSRSLGWFLTRTRSVGDKNQSAVFCGVL